MQFCTVKKIENYEKIKIEFTIDFRKIIILIQDKTYK